MLIILIYSIRLLKHFKTQQYNVFLQLPTNTGYRKLEIPSFMVQVPKVFTLINQAEIWRATTHSSTSS